MVAVICYVDPAKRKSQLLGETFAAGSGGTVVFARTGTPLLPGIAFFYGAAGPLLSLWREAVQSGRTWFYADNSYFDAFRGRCFRVTANALQLSQFTTGAPPDDARFRRFPISIQPWRKNGRHIVVVEQSAHHLGISGAGAGWLQDVCRRLRASTDRPLLIRRWTADKRVAASSLPDALRGAWALVTHTSAAANEALLAGVPVFITGRCAASPMASGGIEKIEQPIRPDGRERWASWLLSNQWTLDEIRSGFSWRMLSRVIDAG